MFHISRSANRALTRDACLNIVGARLREAYGGMRPASLYVHANAEGLSLGTVVKTIRRDDDPLGYDGGVLARVRAMAEDALAGVNEDAVEEEAAVLRSRLDPKPLRPDEVARPGHDAPGN